MFDWRGSVPPNISMLTFYKHSYLAVIDESNKLTIENIKRIFMLGNEYSQQSDEEGNVSRKEGTFVTVILLFHTFACGSLFMHFHSVFFVSVHAFSFWLFRIFCLLRRFETRYQKIFAAAATERSTSSVAQISCYAQSVKKTFVFTLTAST